MTAADIGVGSCKIGPVIEVKIMELTVAEIQILVQ